MLYAISIAIRTRALLTWLLARRSIVLNRAVDRCLGVDTHDIVELAELGLARPDRGFYQGSDWRILRRLLPGSAVTPADVFLDLGSGKGRVLLQAARLPFARVIGVEVSAELCAIAQRNVHRTRRWLRCKAVTVINADVATFRIPDDVTTAYLFNPFTGEIFARVIENLVASIERRPRTLRLLYVHPVCHRELMASDAVHLVREIRTPAFYRWLGGSDAPERFACIYEMGLLRSTRRRQIAVHRHFGPGNDTSLRIQSRRRGRPA
jgi:SAM-dependent methyltransferase